MLAGYVAKPVKAHPKIQKKEHKQKNKISEDYYTGTSHIVLRFCLVGFLVSLVFLGFSCSGKVVAVKEKWSISEAIGDFGNFRKQNLSESSEGPRSEPIKTQFLLWTTHEHF